MAAQTTRRDAQASAGRSPGFGSTWAGSLGNGLTVIVLGNIYNGQPTNIGRDLIAMALGESGRAG